LLSVTFIDENEIDKVKDRKDGGKVSVIPLAERGSRSLSSSQSYQEFELPPLDDILEEEENEVFSKPTELLENSNELASGNTMFSFQTPKKKTGMLEKAESVKKLLRTPTTPKTPTRRMSLAEAGTPKTPKSASKGGNRTPSSKSRRSLSTVLQVPVTPYSFRKRVSSRIQKIVCEEDSSGSEDDDSSYSSDEESEEDKENNVGFNNIKEPKTPRRTPLKASQARTPRVTPSKGRKIKDVEMKVSSDEYFNSQTEGAKVLTSDHTLNRLKTPRLSPEALQSLLKSVATSHPRECQQLIEDQVSMFPRWITYLCEGYSIFLYGLGSKKALISEFQTMFLSDFDHVVVNGFFPSLTLKSILNNITEEIMEHVGSFPSVQEQVNFIQANYENQPGDPLFLLIHNLDGPMLRASKTQAVLARLAQTPNVHLIASIDHINAPLIFDSGKMSKYNALWYDATTLAAYTEETSYENSLMVQQSGALALSSLIHVFKSLTPNAKGVFLLLAKYQLNQKDNPNYQGLSFGDMYQRCREAFLVNSDLTLRAQLTEFRDHKLIKSRKGGDGVENLIIPLDAPTLEEFIQQQEQEGL